jgi:hypothetical protein
VKAARELVILWARALAVLVAVVLALAAVLQWDQVKTQHTRNSLARGA